MVGDEMTAAAAAVPTASTSFPVDCSIISTSTNLSSPAILRHHPPSSDTVLFLLLVLFLFLFNATVILGNTLVISAVLTDDRLRSVTNTFVASLAVADLLLGLAVLPFSSSNQVLHRWPFGDTWCSVWLAVDVWLSTASILNLCAISLDRYLAIGYSFRYPRLMSPRRARFLVAAVWVAAFLICFPPLLGWRRSRPQVEVVNRTLELSGDQTYADDESGVVHVFLRFEEITGEPVSSTFCEGEERDDDEEQGDGSPSVGGGPQQCQLSFDSGYVIYSACGSFWIPMCVMVFFYWRIYVTASRNSKALRRGFVLVPPSDTRGSGGDGRGGGVFQSDSMALRVHRGGVCGSRKATGEGSLSCRSVPSRASEGRSHPPPLRQRSLDFETHPSHPGANPGSSSTHRKHLLRSKSVEAEQSVRTGQDAQRRRDTRGAAFKRGLSSTLFRADGFQARSHLHRLNKEKKAAKTIGIIVGCFVACWAPFFTVYLLGAFCDRCTADRVFAVCFWLGYFNSAINPIIYALRSRDFRTAFKKLLRCGRTAATGGREGLRRRTRSSESTVLRRLASDDR